MAELQRSTGSATTVEEETRPPTEHNPTVVLKLKKPEPDKKVKWDQKTVDNEHMNKKKSKCCCIYEKPRVFGQPDDDTDDDDHGCTDHCHGHKKKDFRKVPESSDGGQQPSSSDSGGAGPTRDPGSSK